MQSYRSSGIVPFTGLLLLILFTAVGGLALGALTAFISQYIYLIILFPLVLIAVGGWIVAQAVKAGKVRNRLVAGLFGLLIALTLYGTYRYGEYIIFRQEVMNGIVAEYGDDIDFALLNDFIDETLEEETGSSGFVGFIRYSAREGIDISFRSTSTPLHLDEQMTWIYWAIEFLAIVLLTPAAAVSAAGAPFSEKCDRWYDGQREYVGSIPAQAEKDFRAMMEANDIRRAAAIVSPQVIEGVPNIHLFTHRAGDCPQDDILLKGVKQTVSRGKTSETQTFAGLLMPMYYNELIRLVQSKQEVSAAA